MEIVRPLFVLLSTCGLLFFVTYLIRFTFKIGWRLAALQTFVVIGGLVWFITEFLSLFRTITFVSLAGIWGGIYLLVLWMCFRTFGANFKKILLDDVLSIKNRLISLPVGLLAILVCAIVALILLGLIAFVASPNTWDSMTYHLGRVMHWQQNHSLAFYPTSIERQLHLGPMAEMIILHLQILSGNDHLANFVQFFSMLGCIAGGTLIAKLLGGNKFAQAFTGIAILTLPMGILQSTSTQNDYVAALWVVCFIVFMLYQLVLKGPNRYISSLAGISLGLAILTKVTTVLFLAGFGAWLVFETFHRFQARSWLVLMTLLGMSILIVTPHFYRNYSMYNNPLGPMVESGEVKYKYTNDNFTIPVLTSNLLRNSAIHLAMPSETWDLVLDKAILKLHSFLNLDINDPRTTWSGTEFQVVYSGEEHSAGNPFHLLLLGASLFAIIRERNKRVIFYFLSTLAGFVLFCWVLKWQPWHSRLHLPLFVLMMPVVGISISRYLNPGRLSLAMLVLFVLALPFILFNPSRPFLGEDSVLRKGRLVQYFAKSSDNYAAYDEQSKLISELPCNDIGLATHNDDWEYPIWVMTKAYGRDIHLEHVLVDNPSVKFDDGFAPCAILVTYPFQDQIIRYQNKDFIKANETGRLSLFLPSNR